MFIFGHLLIIFICKVALLLFTFSLPQQVAMVTTKLEALPSDTQSPKCVTSCEGGMMISEPPCNYCICSFVVPYLEEFRRLHEEYETKLNHLAWKDVSTSVFL